MYLPHILATGIPAKKHSVMPFINQPAMGAVSAIVGDGGNVSLVSRALNLSKNTSPDAPHVGVEPKTRINKPVLEAMLAYNLR